MTALAGSERFSIDTNVLVYCVDATAGEKHRRALEIMDRAVECDCVLSTQVLAEFYHAVTRKRLVPRREAAAQARDWAKAYAVVAPELTELQSALAYAERMQLSIWDALLVATARRTQCTLLLSEDMADGAAFGPVTVINPFRGASLPPRAAAALDL